MFFHPRVHYSDRPDETMLNSELTSSQDASQPMAHKKSRLSKTLGGLSSQLSMDEHEDFEPMKDLVSPIRDKVSPSSIFENRTFSPPKPRTNPSSPRRKISYVSAVQEGELISPQSSYLAPLDRLVEENSSDGVFTHQGLLPDRRISVPARTDLTPTYSGRLLYKRQPPELVQPRLEGRPQKRRSATNLPLPLIGPSAPSDSLNNFSPFHSHSLQHHTKDQESHL